MDPHQRQHLVQDRQNRRQRQRRGERHGIPPRRVRRPLDQPDRQVRKENPSARRHPEEKRRPPLDGREIHARTGRRHHHRRGQKQPHLLRHDSLRPQGLDKGNKHPGDQSADDSLQTLRHCPEPRQRRPRRHHRLQGQRRLAGRHRPHLPGAARGTDPPARPPFPERRRPDPLRGPANQRRL